MLKKSSYWIAGKHTVMSAIKNKKRKVLSVCSTQRNPELEKKEINYKIISKDLFNKRVVSDIAHQNICCEVENFEKNNIKNLLDNELVDVVLLDNITDQRNIGSILRSACAFNYKNIIVRNKDFSQANQALNKSASGALDMLNIYEVSNINNTIDLLKKNMFYIYGLDSNAKDFFSKNSIKTKKNVFIFGSEGRGITHLTKSKCDQLIKLNIHEKIGSLNVSNAVSAFLYALNFSRNV